MFAVEITDKFHLLSLRFLSWKLDVFEVNLISDWLDDRCGC
jgi:hypothetical protein